jgi:hypothetical protein
LTPVGEPAPEPADVIGKAGGIERFLEKGSEPQAVLRAPELWLTVAEPDPKARL